MNQPRMPDRLRAWAVGAARGGTSRPVLRAGHRAVVWLEIVGASLWARRHRVQPTDPGNVTLVIKTFERPQTLRRMLASVRRVFSGPIVIADDSEHPYTSDDPLVSVLRLPFDSGVGAGRNALIDAVSTEYLWMADDDMILLPDFDLRRVVDYLDRNPQVDLCGGRVVNLPQLQAISYLSSDLFAYRGQPIMPLGTLVDSLPVSYKVPNWYLARTERLREVRYDDRLKRVDHKDFFSSAYGRLLCVLDAQMTCLHAHSYFDPHYLAFRQDTTADLAYLAQKWAGGSVVSHAALDLGVQQRSTLHHAAVQVVARDLGVEIVHAGEPAAEVVRVLVAPSDQARLVDGLLTLGWRRAGSRLTSSPWGEVAVVADAGFAQLLDDAVPASFASVPGVAAARDAWPPPALRAAKPTEGSEWIGWSERAGWLDAGDAIVAAALPLGPVYTLTSPGDLIWEIVGPEGGDADAIIAETRAAFTEVPDGVERQIGDYLELLVSRGLLTRDSAKN